MYSEIGFPNSYKPTSGWVELGFVKLTQLNKRKPVEPKKKMRC